VWYAVEIPAGVPPFLLPLSPCRHTGIPAAPDWRPRVKTLDDGEAGDVAFKEQTCSVRTWFEQERDRVVQSKSEAYLRKAEWAQREAESLLNPQEKILLLEIERSFRRLAKIEEWQDAIDLDKRQCERPFA
jgi:hypothetical protein